MTDPRCANHMRQLGEHEFLIKEYFVNVTIVLFVLLTEVVGIRLSEATAENPVFVRVVSA